MNIILLSGGSGKRLWPLSNAIRSKQFLKLISNNQNGLESMIQRVYRQIFEADIDPTVVVTTSAAQVDQVINHLGNNVDIVIEPERCNTFPAILMSCQYLLLQKKLSENDTVLVLPVDQYTELSYFERLKTMEKTVKQGISDIVLMGVTPTTPSTEYGYILPHLDGLHSDVFNVDRFVEKPNASKAQMLIQRGGVWNTGVFAFKLGFIKEITNKYLDGYKTYEDILNQYKSLPKTSFDYEVVEKTSSISMIRYEGKWKDIGSWNTFVDIMDKNSYGDMILTEGSMGTHVINELDIPILVTGATDMIIATSPDGILVSSKEDCA